ncbi:MAG: hypothetical protein ACYC5Q_05690 [Thermoleophilia bacterium]
MKNGHTVETSSETTPAWGGGGIWFDGVLVRKDGLFVLPELEGLNPENLM